MEWIVLKLKCFKKCPENKNKILCFQLQIASIFIETDLFVFSLKAAEQFYKSATDNIKFYAVKNNIYGKKVRSTSAPEKFSVLRVAEIWRSLIFVAFYKFSVVERYNYLKPFVPFDWLVWCLSPIIRL